MTLTTPRTLSLFVTILLGVASTSPAAGCFNVPSTVGQFFGLGFGPGYHAPLELGPGRADLQKPRVQRVLHARSAPVCHHGFCQQETLLVVPTHGAAMVQPTPAPPITPSYAPRPEFLPRPAPTRSTPAAANSVHASRRPSHPRVPTEYAGWGVDPIRLPE